MAEGLKIGGSSSFGMFLCGMDRDLNAKYSPWGNELYGDVSPSNRQMRRGRRKATLNVGSPQA